MFKKKIFKNHIKKKHNKEVPEIEDSTDTMTPQCYDQSTYPCVICDNSSGGVKEFKIHIIEYHDYKKDFIVCYKYEAKVSDIFSYGQFIGR